MLSQALMRVSLLTRWREIHFKKELAVVKVAIVEGLCTTHPCTLSVDHSSKGMRLLFLYKFGRCSALEDFPDFELD